MHFCVTGSPLDLLCSPASPPEVVSLSPLCCDVISARLLWELNVYTWCDVTGNREVGELTADNRWKMLQNPNQFIIICPNRLFIHVLSSSDNRIITYELNGLLIYNFYYIFKKNSFLAVPVDSIMARGCICCVKYMLFLFNLLFWVISHMHKVHTTSDVDINQ